MDHARLTSHMDWLFRLALRLSDSTDDAQELTQETLLCALSSAAEPTDLQAWLATVLRRRHADMLRRKYRLPTVGVDCIPELPAPVSDEAERAEEAAALRREVAFLAGKYREAIVRHYLHGEKVADVASQLDLPRGTVLSRLHAGRQQLRKGLTHMKDYGTHSYQPERLDVSCHGRTGLHDEPFSLVADDLLRQNILLTAYDEPLTPVEIARHMGVPTAYIEPAVDALVRSELMRVLPGGKVATDFLIAGPEERTRTLEVEIGLARAHYDELRPLLAALVHALHATPIHRRMPAEEQGKLDAFFLLHLLSSALYTALQRIAPGEDVFPPRPDGGEWIAVGSRYPMDFDFSAYAPGRYCYGGMRWACLEDCLGAKSIALHVYDTQPALNRYQHGPAEMDDVQLLRLLRLIHTGSDPREAGFEPGLLANIPHLADCGVLRLTDGKPTVALPVMTTAEYNALDALRLQQLPALADALEGVLRPALPRLRTRIPQRLEGRIAPVRRIQSFAIPMALREEALRRGDLPADAPVPPMILLVDE